MDRRKKTGRQGEALAAAFLTEQGYGIIRRNWRCAAGEVDLIVEKENTLIFVEVRTRRGSRFGSAAESITPAKQARLIALAQTYCQELNPPHLSWRIDVVTVELNPGPARIEHIENAVGW
jgi:putative endonuclease